LAGYYFGGRQVSSMKYKKRAIPLSQERMRQLSAIMKNGRRPSFDEFLKA
jgi:hypothetical protein